MSVAVVLFTRDLRVHDHPALHAAVTSGDRVVPLFVVDDAILASGHATPNRMAFLLDSLRDLRASLTARSGSLLVRRGDVAHQVARLVGEVGASSLHASADVSRYAHRRERALRSLCDDLAIGLHLHPGVTVVEPEDVRTTSGGHYEVFTPYWRRWSEVPQRAPLPPPDRVTLPSGVATGRIPALGDLVDGAPSPDLQRGGEARARARLDAWFDGAVGDYDRGRDELAAETSRLSADLHFGTLSPAEVADRVDRRRDGHESFLRQLCWRDFDHQLTAADPGIVVDDHRGRGDRWRDDPEAVAAWKEGRTGYPVVDAAMRQLRREGWMHNRARLLAASFLTKHLYVDWRVGARHFWDLLVDGDIANNAAQWQWVAGTGTDPRPNRMFNPVTQSRRYDPAGRYIRRYVPELRDLSDDLVHEPWRGDPSLSEATGYPAPIVDHAEARQRFLEARGAA